ncbi:alpha/beta fold hydrolase [Luteibacter yeojuensis]|uniref:alpha/beta fold hydrolase n=1 Tax=Luteibacter yeojuensis TaxID=345309 RepID=UPI000A008930
MHIYCAGSGSPTVVLEFGNGGDFTIWGKVQPALSRTTRTCSYDRAGFGWSEAQSGPRDASHIARQLKMLLNAAGIHEPIILVGHSAGGLYASARMGRGCVELGRCPQ